jgi:hypothetical protein
MYNNKCVNMIYIPFAQPALGVMSAVGLTERKSGRHCEMKLISPHGFSSLISTFPLCVCLHLTSPVALRGNSVVLE